MLATVPSVSPAATLNSMWTDLIQKAKDGGLAIIQTYVFWNGHVPSPGKRFPVWLKYVPGISFRTDNGPFKDAMERFKKKIVDMMKAESLFESQGGLIIMSQIENESGPMVYEIGAPGKAYTEWETKMVVGVGTIVPWIMCEQDDAPDPIINTCNGFYYDYFSPNKAYKPKMCADR